MSDLPAGQWSALLVGHQWPGSSALASLTAAAGSRGAVARAYEEYGNALRAIRTQTLAAQDGAAAEEIRRAFLDGEARAREIAEHCRAKQTAYESARQCAENLRSGLADIAATGDADIRRILDSSAPTPAKVSAIVETVTAAQRSANSAAVSASANVFDGIQRVLHASGLDVSARQFALANGFSLHGSYRAPDADGIRDQVAEIVDCHSGDGPPADPAPTPPAEHAPPTTPISRMAEALAVGAVNAVRTSAATVGTLDARPAPARESVPLDAVTGSASSGPAAANEHPVLHSTPAPLAGGRPQPVAGPVTPGPVGRVTGALSAYGADLRRPTVVAPAVVTAKPGPAVTGAGPGVALSHPPLVRRRPEPSFAAGVGRERAVQPRPDPGLRLRRLLSAMVRQQPRLCWGLGDLADGSTLVVTDVADGWIPPGIGIPAGLRLLRPELTPSGGGDMSTLLGSATRIEIYQPGQPLSASQDAEPVAMSATARVLPRAGDLGWELARATKWREGLPRVAHILARAAAGGTGCPDSEIAVLRTHLDRAAREVLSRYPDTVDPVTIADWQLLATVESLAAGETDSANYHFAWFQSREPERSPAT